MIQLVNHELVLSFPEVHPEARMTVRFHRTLRIPDDGRDYPLPPSLGHFPLEHVDDHASRLPETWRRRGGIMLPMYASEALWLSFHASYPMAVKVAAGKINALTGEDWSEGLGRGQQDYLVVPSQPWLDGYVTDRGRIRQFVAMPLGAGYSLEEQLTGQAEHGGIQLVAYPMDPEAYEEHKRTRPLLRRSFLAGLSDAGKSGGVFDGNHHGHSWLMRSHQAPLWGDSVAMYASEPAASCSMSLHPDMGLGMGGSMRQEVYVDEFGRDQWRTHVRARCFVHLTSALLWRQLTSREAPTTPCTAEEYARHGYPWFEYYGDGQEALEGASPFKKVKSVAEKSKEKEEVALPDNESVDVESGVVPLGPGRGDEETSSSGVVREGAF